MNRRKFFRIAAGGAVLLFEAACRPQTAPSTNVAPPAGSPPAPSPTSDSSAGIVQSAAPTADPNLGQHRLELPRPLQTTEIDHFYVTTYSDTMPGFDPVLWSLSIDGLVDQPLKFNYDELRARPAVEVMRTLECIGNSVGGSLISNGTWKGVSLKKLLEEAGVKPGATHLIMDGADDYFTAAPIALALTEEALLVYELNGKPLTVEHGRPLRVLLPGLYGQKQPKWLTHIQVADHSEKGPWEKKGWSDDAVVQPNSRIDRPLDNNIITGKPGEIFTITGVAFSSSPGVARVEVSTDGGASWADAVLTHAPQPFANYVWTAWGFDWKLPASGEYEILARMTDGAGGKQGDPTKKIFFGAFPNGTNAIQTVTVEVKSI